MTNTDFWNSIRSIIDEGFNSEGLAKLRDMQTNSSTDSYYLNDFHRENSMAAHPCC